ncbi:hypothetical protein SUS17_1541 [Sphingomonas sp. S17]|nr:hypothetical protein SUS17_1541 [Sphingomonas sp. S17]
MESAAHLSRLFQRDTNGTILAWLFCPIRRFAPLEMEFA